MSCLWTCRELSKGDRREVSGWNADWQSSAIGRRVRTTNGTTHRPCGLGDFRNGGALLAVSSAAGFASRHGHAVSQGERDVCGGEVRDREGCCAASAARYPMSMWYNDDLLHLLFLVPSEIRPSQPQSMEPLTMQEKKKSGKQSARILSLTKLITTSSFAIGKFFA